MIIILKFYRQLNYPILFYNNFEMFREISILIVSRSQYFYDFYLKNKNL